MASTCVSCLCMNERYRAAAHGLHSPSLTLCLPLCGSLCLPCFHLSSGLFPWLLTLPVFLPLPPFLPVSLYPQALSDFVFSPPDSISPSPSFLLPRALCHLCPDPQVILAFCHGIIPLRLSTRSSQRHWLLFSPQHHRGPRHR